MPSQQIISKCCGGGVVIPRALPSRTARRAAAACFLKGELLRGSQQNPRDAAGIQNKDPRSGFSADAPFFSGVLARRPCRHGYCRSAVSRSFVPYREGTRPRSLRVVNSAAAVECVRRVCPPCGCSRRGFCDFIWQCANVFHFCTFGIQRQAGKPAPRKYCGGVVVCPRALPSRTARRAAAVCWIGGSLRDFRYGTETLVSPAAHRSYSSFDVTHLRPGCFSIVDRCRKCQHLSASQSSCGATGNLIPAAGEGSPAAAESHHGTR